VNINSLLSSSRYQYITFFVHNLIILMTFSTWIPKYRTSLIVHPKVIQFIRYNPISIINGTVMFNHSHYLTSSLMNKLTSIIPYISKPLHYKSLILNANRQSILFH
jgi:REP element-mobilizing transposase RayT